MNEQPQPLGERFLDWWFAPWDQHGKPPDLAPTRSLLARRTGYRLWCDAAGVPADLPPTWDSGWQMLALADGALLRRAACLYAALLAARLARPAQLAALPMAQRRWCLGVANTQPLRALTDPDPTCSLESWGIAELAGALSTGFAGMWPRLRLVLDAPDMPVASTPVQPAAATRSLRCWRMCLERAARAERADFGPQP